MRWEVIVGLAAGLLVAWLGLVVMLWRMNRRVGERFDLDEALQILPDVIRLLRRITKDPNTTRSVRIGVLVVIGYLALPFDVVPDFIPVLGYADDILVVAITLRWIVRRNGMAALERHWSGTSNGLRVIKRLAGLS